MRDWAPIFSRSFHLWAYKNDGMPPPPGKDSQLLAENQHYIPQLVGGLEHFLFFHILGITIPTDELIFFKGVGQPPTSQLLAGNFPQDGLAL